MSAPYMPLYVADYLSATEHLDAALSGAYLHLLMHFWQKGSLPSEDKFLSRIARMSPKQWQSAKPTIKAFFNEDWTNDRALKERDKAHLKSEARATCGAMGGEAKALKTKEAALAKASVLPQQKPQQKPSEALPSSSGLGLEKIIDAGASIADAAASAARLQSEEDRKRIAEKRQTVLRSLGERWNNFAGELRLPQIEEIKTGSPRERAALARVRDGCDFDRVFAKIRSSPFLRGEKGSTPASFDWITNPTNYQKIIEGNYDEVRQAQRR